MRAFAQEASEQEKYNQSIAHVLKLSYKEALARGIFWGSVSICTVNKRYITNEYHMFLNYLIKRHWLEEYSGAL